MSKQITGRRIWEECNICGSLNNLKAKGVSPCLSIEECKAQIVGGKLPPKSQSDKNQDNPSDSA